MASGSKKRASPGDVHIAVRGVVAVVFLIMGIAVANTSFFEENHLFGVEYLASVLFALIAGLLGFFIIPKFFVQVKHWAEDIIAKAVAETVSSFWEQQSRRMQDARRQRQRRKKAENEEKRKDILSNSVLLDTSVLVDGRILALAKTGFLSTSLIVPQFVLNELHLVSDNEDSLKRKRGRRGLDILKNLKKQAKVVILEDVHDVNNDVDKALVEICKKYKTKLMTLDFNLNKVAGVAGIKVLNINELANAVRAMVLPGEIIKLKVLQEGKEKKQGVGYLSDGTMVVVKDAKDLIGKTSSVEVTKVIQSPAGKMIFAKISK